MPLIPGELLARAFLSKSLISPSFTAESSNFSSGGCGRLGSLRRPSGVSVSGSVYFFRMCASKSSFGILRTPFFSPSNNFLVNLKVLFFEIAPSFSFLLSTLPCVFCSCNDKDLFLKFRQLLLHKLTLIWHFFNPLLKKPLLFSKPALFSLSSIDCSYVFFLFGRLQFLGKLHE